MKLEPRPPSGRERLDQALVGRGLVATRSKARDFVLRGLVSVDGSVVAKPAHEVTPDNRVTLAAHAPQFVSRAAEKLVGGLAGFGFSCAGRVVIDVGSSTGGFTQVLLAHGATRVYAVDVGRDQLHATLRADPRVVSLESTDARALTSTLVPDAATAIVTDVSFISLEKALPAALALAAPQAWLVALIKPQFEVGRERVGKGGIVRDAEARDSAVMRIRRWLGEEMAWHVVGVAPSPITGGDGNIEYLIGATKT